MPISNAMPTDTKISASVSMLDSQSPRNPITEKPTAATMARRQPASTPASAAAPTITPRYVMRFKTFVVTVEQSFAASLIGFRK